MSKAKRAMVEAIKAGNARFEKATPAQKRVIIAQDAIDQVRMGRFAPTSGIYVEPANCNVGYDVAYKNLHKMTLHPEKTKGLQCVGCALGGLFIAQAINKPAKNSSVLREQSNCVGDYEFPEDIDGNPVSPNLMPLIDFFSVEQLRLIEAVFEGFSDRDVGGRTMEAWHSGPYREEKTRFVAIMRNIVTNRGTFKPNQRPPKVPYNLSRKVAKRAAPKKRKTAKV
jgi:hypothetical protein